MIISSVLRALKYCHIEKTVVGGRNWLKEETLLKQKKNSERIILQYQLYLFNDVLGNENVSYPNAVIEHSSSTSFVVMLSL